MEDRLINIKNSAVSLILDCNDLESLEEIRIEFIGRSGQLTTAIKEIAKIPLEKRPEVGMLANEVKKAIEEAIESQKSKVKNQNY